MKKEEFKTKDIIGGIALVVCIASFSSLITLFIALGRFHSSVWIMLVLTIISLIVMVSTMDEEPTNKELLEKIEDLEKQITKEEK